jgi:hypothetical protein
MRASQPTERYRRVGTVRCREVGESTFLVDLSHDKIHHLNIVGAAVWKQLAEPVSAHELAEALHTAFTAVARDRIVEDVDALLDELLAVGLIARA